MYIKVIVIMNRSDKLTTGSQIEIVIGPSVIFIGKNFDFIVVSLFLSIIIPWQWNREPSTVPGTCPNFIFHSSYGDYYCLLIDLECYCFYVVLSINIHIRWMTVRSSLTWVMMTFWFVITSVETIEIEGSRT